MDGVLTDGHAKRETVHSGEEHVGDEEGDLLASDEQEGSHAIRRLEYVSGRWVPCQETPLQVQAHVRVVVHDEDGGNVHDAPLWAASLDEKGSRAEVHEEWFSGRKER